MSKTAPGPGKAALREQRSQSFLPPPDQHHLVESVHSDSDSSLVFLSQEISRQPTPATRPAQPSPPQIHRLDHDEVGVEEEEAGRTHLRHSLEEEADDTDMPSDLRPQVHRQTSSLLHEPLLSGDKQQRYASPSRSRNGSRTRQSSRFRERENEMATKDDTRTRYTYAAIFLMISLVTFAVQTETAVYIQHNLKWNKAYCMLYLTHGSWSLLWPFQLLILRIRKWNQPWDAFWRRHLSIIRSTAQMVEHRTIHVPSHLSKKSPVPYFTRIVPFVTCALTVAGGSWYVAVNLTTASDLTAIYNCSAFFAYAFAVPLLHEKLQLSKVVAVGIAIFGVLVMAYGDQSSVKHGSKSGGGAGGPDAPEDHEASNRLIGNLIIGFGSVLYGFYEVLYKKVACPPDGCSPGRGMLFANTFGTMIGLFTLSVLWIPLPILHYMGWETFELPTGEAAWMLAISVLANVTFSGSFLILISLTSPVLSSVAALLTIFLVALCDQVLPPPLYHPLTAAALAGGMLIIFAFALLSWATYKEMEEENRKKAQESIEESDAEDV